MASYWTKKDDQSDETKTIKPWEEMVSNGDKEWPDPSPKPDYEDEGSSSQL